MINFEDPSLPDLLSNASFRQWVSSGDFRRPDNKWSKWLAEHPGQRETVRHAVEILSASHLMEEVTDATIDEIVGGTWNRIENTEKQHAESKRLEVSWWRVSASVAASFLLLILAWWSFRNAKMESVNKKEELAITEKIIPSWTKYSNNDTKSRLLILPDSSSVLLLPGSTLLCPMQFASDIREVKLTGEAFFEITRRTHHPFLVRTEEITTRVLGTSFNVRAYPNESEVKVLVKNGKVAVYAQKGADESETRNSITLSRDQQVIYNKIRSQLARTVTVSKINISPIQKASFDFDDTPVRTILDSIAHVYELDLKYESKGLDKCILTTTLTDVPLPKKLSIICEALGENMKYDLSESRIVIRGAPACE